MLVLVAVASVAIWWRASPLVRAQVYRSFGDETRAFELEREEFRRQWRALLAVEPGLDGAGDDLAAGAGVDTVRVEDRNRFYLPLILENERFLVDQGILEIGSPTAPRIQASGVRRP